MAAKDKVQADIELLIELGVPKKDAHAVLAAAKGVLHDAIEYVRMGGFRLMTLHVNSFRLLYHDFFVGAADTSIQPILQAQQHYRRPMRRKSPRLLKGELDRLTVCKGPLFESWPRRDSGSSIGTAPIFFSTAGMLTINFITTQTIGSINCCCFSFAVTKWIVLSIWRKETRSISS
jgi:hypothetical protein